jgi:hypothetical protein
MTTFDESTSHQDILPCGCVRVWWPAVGLKAGKWITTPCEEHKK